VLLFASGRPDNEPVPQAREAPELSPSPFGIASPRARLVTLSFLMLFVELVLIRWSSAYNVYLAYFTNFVLLASFLGIGVGFLRDKRGPDRLSLAPIALLGLALFAALGSVEGVLRTSGIRLRGLFGGPALPIWVILPVIFLGVFAVMEMIGEGVSRTFARFEPLEAYRLDILGSLGGIAAFSVISLAGAPPAAWALVIAAAFVVLLGRGIRRAQALALGGFVLLLAIQSLNPVDHWSPYYRVYESHGHVKVNGIPHQQMVSVEFARAHQQRYFYPYRHLLPGTSLDEVLIVGAGTGNDVAVALSEGAKHVDAVEIDPVLYRIGFEHHPNHPYQDPRVTAHINDGRAFLHDAEKHYDLILFALPDSLSLVSGQGSLRLESYLFTTEAMGEVRDHLKPHGVFSMYNYYNPHVFGRYARTIALAFGHAPCVDRNFSNLNKRLQAVLTIGLRSSAIRCSHAWKPPVGVMPQPATDDHPFPYLEGRTIPTMYVIALLLILLASGFAVRRVSGPFVRMQGYLDLFFMGAAFLLLETKNVVQFALLFGTTWFVNALVFGGILLSVYAAIEVAKRFRPRRPVVLYVPLLAALALAWVVPPDSLLQLAFLPRFGAAVGLAFAPIFLANLVFAERFKDVGSSTVAFGANLLGAMVGGLLEYGALVVGYRALLVAVAVLYGLAFLVGRRHLLPERAASPAPPQPVYATAGAVSSATRSA
jgi:SAM-dependent methyltransferase